MPPNKNIGDKVFSELNRSKSIEKAINNFNSSKALKENVVKYEEPTIKAAGGAFAVSQMPFFGPVYGVIAGVTAAGSVMALSQFSQYYANWAQNKDIQQIKGRVIKEFEDIVNKDKDLTQNEFEALKSAFVNDIASRWEETIRVPGKLNQFLNKKGLKDENIREGIEKDVLDQLSALKLKQTVSSRPAKARKDQFDALSALEMGGEQADYGEGSSRGSYGEGSSRGSHRRHGNFKRS
jgi:hypothetical protein